MKIIQTVTHSKNITKYRHCYATYGCRKCETT